MNSCIYGKYKEPHIVEHGVYKGRHWCIRMFSHPCAYVEKKQDDSEKVIDGKVHDGITYEGTLPNSENQEIMFPYCNLDYWGWDYAHYGDFVFGSSCQEDKVFKMWTSEEIIQEIYDAIDALDKRKAEEEELKGKLVHLVVGLDAYEYEMLMNILEYEKENQNVIEPRQVKDLEKIIEYIKNFVIRP